MLKCINCLVNYGVVLLLGVVSLMVGTAMVYRYLLGMVGTNNNIRNNRLLHWALQVPHHPGSTCYPTEAPKYCATPYVAPAYTTKAPEYYTTKAPEYYTTKAPAR
jgi:hypothetical protein